MQDRNFDDLAARFQRNVYGTLKGQLRLRVLQRDFAEIIPGLLEGRTPWRILDAGAGQAQFSLQLAQAGHQVVLADISTKMLQIAAQQLQVCSAQVQQNVQVINAAIQSLPGELADKRLPTQHDLVICHAVLEWLGEPEQLYKQLKPLCKPGAYLSLIFYNINGLAFKNLLRGNFNKFDIDTFKAFRGSLTPTHPQDPEHVQQCLESEGFEVLCRSGIRVFHDYILDPEIRNSAPDALTEKELQYSRRAPFWQMARYIHFLARFNT